ncbi:MAG: orotidine 5'-phosphate decarboxylase / HUMPS family protein [Planctomycetota bacterium]|jgi:3-hexulose-6-phosphate synthase/6-phospho-3-hexuloisomerase
MSYQQPTAPVIQAALDFLNTDQALAVAEPVYAAGVRWIEAGTPLIKSEGLEVVRVLRRRFADATIIADMKVMDAGRTEVEAANKAGADVVMVLAASTEATIRECVAAGRHVGCAIGCDLVGVADPVARAREVAAMGVDLISVHTPIDQQMEGVDGLDTLRAVAAAVEVPVMCAGGLSPATIPAAIEAGATVAIVGGAIAKAPDRGEAALAALAALAGASAEGQELYQRVGRERIREVLARVSSANLSDAMHRGGALAGLTDRNPGVRLCGPAVTVQSAPGDWAKPVQAIDRCQPGDVLVIDAAGAPPALWGGLATLTARERGLAGVVINGACRDIEEIVGGDLAVWSTLVCPDAGEPKGIGAFDVPLVINGAHINPGDWLFGDASGLVVVPANDIVAVANRAQDILEREQSFAAEIRGGRSLADIAELAKWERQA